MLRLPVLGNPLSRVVITLVVRVSSGLLVEISNSLEQQSPTRISPQTPANTFLRWFRRYLIFADGLFEPSLMRSNPSFNPDTASTGHYLYLSFRLLVPFQSTAVSTAIQLHTSGCITHFENEITLLIDYPTSKINQPLRYFVWVGAEGKASS